MSSSSDSKIKSLQDSGLVDWSVLSEIIQMDEDEEDFSQQLFETFVNQVNDTFKEINHYLKTKDLDNLSKTGHFLKGSAAALGLTLISQQCERIQNYGHKINFDNFDIRDVDREKIKDVEEDGVETNENGKNKYEDKENNITKDSITKDNKKDDEFSILDQSSDEYWILLIKDALAKAKSGFISTKKALDDYFETE
ncbi:unnamed protein product [Candida verbasci]|uniref:HPt domain-containing protein n=1 Tax=Candida verbasci TaxID=1227364 RepID=A0A9W4TSW0_9ASCO|nr:unnamed protein product [Candida verbasci]